MVEVLHSESLGLGSMFDSLRLVLVASSHFMLRLQALHYVPNSALLDDFGDDDQVEVSLVAWAWPRHAAYPSLPQVYSSHLPKATCATPASLYMLAHPLGAVLSFIVVVVVCGA